MNKPVIIDYPVDRELLKKEFGLIASRPGFQESVEKAKDMLAGKNKHSSTTHRKNSHGKKVSETMLIGKREFKRTLETLSKESQENIMNALFRLLLLREDPTEVKLEAVDRLINQTVQEFAKSNFLIEAA
jgi:hypothetical protein